jgi:hypothetical protein
VSLVIKATPFSEHLSPTNRIADRRTLVHKERFLVAEIKSERFVYLMNDSWRRLPHEQLRAQLQSKTISWLFEVVDLIGCERLPIKGHRSVPRVVPRSCKISIPIHPVPTFTDCP